MSEDDVDRESARYMGINFVCYIQDLIRRAVNRSESSMLAELSKLREEVRELREQISKKEEHY